MSKPSIQKEPTTIISHCNFTGVQWDGKAIEAVNMVANGLLNLTELFKSQNIRIDTMISMAAKTEHSKAGTV